MNGTSSFFNRQASKKIKILEDKIKAKDEKIKTNKIETLKRMIAAFNVNFDTAFTASRFESSLKEE